MLKNPGLPIGPRERLEEAQEDTRRQFGRATLHGFTLGSCDAAEADVAHAGVDHLGLAFRRTIT